MLPRHSPSDDPALVGEKAANLARLAKVAGVAIPPYFVVATPVLEAALVDVAPSIAALESEPLGSEAIPRLARQVRERILAAPLPPGVADGLIDAYRAFSRRFGELAVCVSVRSSATAEDGADASFAGQYTSCLNVRGEAALLQSLREVWASTWSERALDYRKRRLAGPAPVGMAAIVQQMVEAAAAGTLYTLDPESGAPAICINAVPGLGMAEVSGQRTPVSWLVDPRTMTVLRRRGPPGAEDPIRPDTLLELAGQAQRIGACFKADWGVPALELEFACTAAGQIFFTQARPETVWSLDRAQLTAVDTARAPHLAPVFAGGATGCPGVVAGVLRMASSLAEAQAAVQAGDILVAPTTANVWERLLGRLGGIVTEVGGTGSHTAVVMRELGRPALVGAAGALQALAAYRDRPVTLDATQRLIFAGTEAADNVHRLVCAQPSYTGPDREDEDASWAEASAQPGRTLTDAAGERWILKPEYPVCAFMQSVYLDAHRWIGQRLGLPVRNEVRNGVHRIPFADVWQWRLRLRGLGLEALERLQQEREACLAQYLAASAGLVPNPESLRHWLDLYLRVNAFIGLGYAFYRVTEGLLEQALAQQRVLEPYYSQIRRARGGPGELESSRAARALGALVAQVQAEPRLAGALAEACDQRRDEPFKARGCRGFYRQIERHARAFKVTPVAEIDLPLGDAVLAVAQSIREALKDGPRASGAPPRAAGEELDFFPYDPRLRRIHRLALAAERTRQDSHHLRVRGHWLVRDRLVGLAEHLMARGTIDRFGALFERPPEWLLEQAQHFCGHTRAANRSKCHVR